MKFSTLNHKNLYKNWELNRSSYVSSLTFITIILGLVFGLLTLAISIRSKITSSINYEFQIKHDYHPDSEEP